MNRSNDLFLDPLHAGDSHVALRAPRNDEGGDEGDSHVALQAPRNDESGNAGDSHIAPEACAVRPDSVTQSSSQLLPSRNNEGTKKDEEAAADYQKALEILHALDMDHMDLRLDRIQKVLETLGNPQDRLSIIHVAGSNGKGSTVAMLQSILLQAGYKIGAYISPHLIDVRERITWDGKMIPQDDFSHEVVSLQAHLATLEWPVNQWPTYFEFLNIIAYRYFVRKGADITLFEAGLGGRLDSTNVVQKPLVSIITSISLEHTDRLGPTLALIAFEKAGILKTGCPAVLGPQLPPEALNTIVDRATEVNTPLFFCRHDDILPSGQTAEGIQILQDAKTGKTYALSLLGPYQRHNLATVFQTVAILRRQGWLIPDCAVQEGLRHVQWPARFQYLPFQNILIDGSHNKHGFESLADGIRQHFLERPLIWLLSLRKNREPQQLLNTVCGFPNTRAILWTVGNKVSLYHPPEYMEALTRALLAHADTALNIRIESEIIPEKAFNRLPELLKAVGKKEEPTEALGIITGSLYTAGLALKHLANTGFH